MFKKQILEKLESINQLPAMVSVAAEVERLLNDPKTTIEQLEYAIKNEPVLTAKVLKLANSAAYAGTRRIVGLNQAISRLGYAELRKLVIAVTFLNLYRPKVIKYDTFWLHSISTAYTAVKLSEFSPLDFTKDNAFIGAVLHDIGILVFDQFFYDLYSKVFEISMQKGIDLLTAERDIMGITHAEAGAILLKKWNLPKEITEIVEYHHKPHKSTISPNETKLVYLSNSITNIKGLNFGTNTVQSDFDDSVWKDLNLSTNDIPKIIEEVQAEIDKAQEFMKLGGR